MTEVKRGSGRIVIVGAGFGGLTAAKGLAGKLVDVLVVDRNNYHLFVPLLYQVATAGLAPDEVAHPVRATLRRARNVHVRQGEVVALDATRRVVAVEGRGEESYDALILAIGSVNNTFGLAGVKTHALGLKDLESGAAVRNKVLSAFEQANWERDPDRRRALMTLAVVGGGATGVEMAGALIELLRHVIRKDMPDLDLREARVVLIEAGPLILDGYPDDLRRKGLAMLRSLGVEVMLEASVASADAGGVTLRSGARLDSATVIWAAGVKGADLRDGMGFERVRGSRIAVLPTLQHPAHPELFLIGDIASLDGEDGRPLPMLASVAMQQGAHAARNALALVTGGPLIPFRYKDWGTMATIGRGRAVAHLLGGVRLSGWIAWVTWLGYHLMRLVGYRNRMNVLVNWIYNYVTYDRGARLIFRDRPEPPPAEQKEP